MPARPAQPDHRRFDELWGYTSERGIVFGMKWCRRRREDRLPVDREVRGFEGESALEGLHKRGLQGKQVEPDLYAANGMLMFWTNRFTAPWQTEDWREQMREQLRPNAYLRLIENRWVSPTAPSSKWNGGTAASTIGDAVVADRDLPVWVGVDASVKRDSTAIVACTWDAD